MPTLIDVRQVADRLGLDQVAPTAGTTLDSTLPSINSELTMPLRMTATSTPNQVLNIGASKVTNPQTGRTRTTPLLSGTVLNFTSGTITFPTTSGGTITASTGATGTLTLASGQFVWVLVEITSANALVFTVGTPAGSLGAAAYPAPGGTNLSIGYVSLSNVGGTIQTITNSNIVQLPLGAGGGSGGGSVTSIAGGGTGQTTAAAAYNALSPMTTVGDIEYELTAGVAARLPIGSTGQVLTVASGLPAWSTPVLATATQNGLMSTTTQTIAGAKTWNDVQTWYEGGGATQVGSYNTSGSWTLGYVNPTSTSHQIYGQSGAYSTATPVLNISSSSATYAPGLNIGLDTSGTGNAWIQTVSSGSSGGVGLDFCAYEAKVGGYTSGGNWQLGTSGGNNTHNAYIGANGAFNVNVDTQSSGNNAYITCGGASIGGYGYGGTYKTWPYINLVVPGQGQAYYWTAGNGNFMQSGILSNVGTTTGTVVGTQTSDERLKTDIKPTKYGLDTVLALKPIDFVMHGQAKSGFGAQTTRSVLPEAVYDSGDKIAGHESEENKLGMDYVQIIPALVKGMQEQQIEIEALRAEVRRLSKQ